MLVIFISVIVVFCPGKYSLNSIAVLSFFLRNRHLLPVIHHGLQPWEPAIYHIYRENIVYEALSMASWQDKDQNIVFRIT